MDKFKILSDAKTQREMEIFGYQINIDNYELAIKECDIDIQKSISRNTLRLIEIINRTPLLPFKSFIISLVAKGTLLEFRTKLEKLLEDEKLEQKKSKVMLSVICKQLEEMQCSTKT